MGKFFAWVSVVAWALAIVALVFAWVATAKGVFIKVPAGHWFFDSLALSLIAIGSAQLSKLFCGCHVHGSEKKESSKKNSKKKKKK